MENTLRRLEFIFNPCKLFNKKVFSTFLWYASGSSWAKSVNVGKLVMLATGYVCGMSVWLAKSVNVGEPVKSEYARCVPVIDVELM